MKDIKFITVQGIDINILSIREDDYISLTDITAKFPDGKFLVPRWLRNRDTLEFLGVWEKLNNPNFKVIEFDNLYAESGHNRFSMSVTRWVEETNAIGFKLKKGKGGHSYAHKDIALGFCYWLSPPFQLYVINEFQRLKKAEAQETRQELDWNLRRTLAKVNYRIHTEAVKLYLLPPKLGNSKLEGLYYASEADLLNLAVFGMTAKDWRLQNPETKGNLRDNASTEQLLVISNLENLNAEFIRQGLTKEQRLERLNEIAIYQMELLLDVPAMKHLTGGQNEKK